MISHLFNRCSKCCTSRKSGTGKLLFDDLMAIMMEAKPSNCFYKMICPAITHAL